MKNNTLTTPLEKILSLVEIFLSEPDGFSAAELQAQTQLTRSTLFTLLAEMKTLGYLEQNEKRGKYRCGARLLAWRAFSGDFRQEMINAFQQEFSRQSFPETLLLVMPLQAQIQVLRQIEGHQTIRCSYQPGSTSDRLNSALGLFSGSDETILNNGFALDAGVEELQIAVPICPDGSTPQAALVMCAPSYRWKMPDFEKSSLPQLKNAAARLSYRMGALTYAPFQLDTSVALPHSSELSESEIQTFLNQPLTARLACLRPDGLPHVIPVWQEWDGQAFTVAAWEGSAWAVFVRNNPNVSLTIDEPWPPFRRLIARGEAQPLPLEPGNGELNQLARRLTQRYMGSAALPPSGVLTAAFYIQPYRLRGWQGLTFSEPAHAD